MGLSKLAAECQACPYVNTCDHKRMEALGYLMLPEHIELRDSPAISDELLDRISRIYQIPPVILQGDFEELAGYLDRSPFNLE